MTSKSLKLIFITTPIGALGSGKGGGVELTIISLIKGLIYLGHQITLVAPFGSEIPFKLLNNIPHIYILDNFLIKFIICWSKL